MNLIKPVLILVLFSSALAAQEFGVSYLKMWSNDSQLKNPEGYGIYVYVPIKKIALRAEYNYAEGEANYFGYLNSGFFLPVEDAPKQENVNTTSVMKSYEFSIWFSDLISAINPVRLNIGAGIGGNDLEGNRKGNASGKEASFKSTGRFGILFGVSLSYSRPLDLPFKLELLYKLKSLPSSGAMATDTENVFQDAIGIKQLSLGISYIYK